MVYEFKGNSRLGGNAQIVGETLECVRQREGRLMPSLVVEEAKPEQNPLHRYFEWDDTLAASKHREDQARHLIRSVVVLPDAETRVKYGKRVESVRAFLSVSGEGAPERRYESTEVVMRSPVLKEQILRDVRSELVNLRHKVEELEEFEELVGGFKHLQLRVTETLEDVIGVR